MRRLLLTTVGAVAALTAAPAPAQVYQAIGVPGGHMPPPGWCRVWYPDRPPGHQPPPTDCRTAAWQAQRYGGRLIWGGSQGSHGGYAPGSYGSYGSHSDYGSYAQQGYGYRPRRVCVQWDRWGSCVRRVRPGEYWNPDWRGGSR